MGYHWSTHQLTEYFTAVIDADNERAAVQAAVERAAEAMDAEVGALVRDGSVLASVGLGATVPADAMVAAASGADMVELPGLGPMHATAARLGRRDRGSALAVARMDEAFSAEERQMLQGMAQVLGLALRGIAAVAVERALREEQQREAEERLRLLDKVRGRQRLVETLLAIQRAISHRRPLAEVLSAVTSGASRLLDHAVVTLMLADPVDDKLIMAATSANADVEIGQAALLAAAERAMANDGVITARGENGEARSENGEVPGEDGQAPGQWRLIAAPVHVAGAVSGSLVAIAPGAAPRADEQSDLLSAFAQQVSLALTDARTLEAMREAYHDQLTGLPNRALFLERANQALASSAARTGGVVVLFVDLDGFKTVNDSLGHTAGDELLAEVSRRIQACVRTGDVAARLGGDEFAVLLDGSSVDAGVEVARRIIEAVKRPFRVAGRDVFIGASIGLTHADAASADAASGDAAGLLSNADVAMYQAKRTGSGRVEIFAPRMHAAALERLNLAADLQRALERDEFRLHYQPLVRLGDGRPTGVEALLRWTHPVRGGVSPASFIPIVEETGLILDIGRWVLLESARQVAQWRRTLPDLTLNVNVSARQFLDPAFVNDVAMTAATVGLPTAAITLELTETAFMTDPDSALAQMCHLKKLGANLSIDDFGTGYSSLSYLRRFPVDEVKIDRAFIGGIGHGADDLAIVQAIIDLGRVLRLRTVAEGIEEVEQLDLLRRLDCDMGQGYHFARPMEPAAAFAYLRGEAAPALAA